MTKNDEGERGYTPAPAPANEAARLATLRSMGVLDTPPEAAFDDITRIAAYVCQAPMALISLVEEDRQWFKSTLGLDVAETPRDHAFCGYSILGTEVMEVRDAATDPRFAGNPLVVGGPRLRYYAGAPLRTAEGHALGTVCVLDTRPRELSDEQKAVLSSLARQTVALLKLRRALASAERANRHRSRLMAVAGHDLKQPLQVMTMAIDRFAAIATEDKDKERAHLAMDCARALARELDDLARASRLEDDDEAPQIQVFRAEQVLRPLEGNWRHLAERKGLALEVDACPDEITSDPAMLSTILNNLVGNALKYTTEGAVKVACDRFTDRLAITVSDTGRGIPAEQQGKIFEAFTQMDPSADGLGLGLAIVRRTADVLGHPLSIRSEVGRGSAFTVEAPLAGEAA